MTSRQTTFVRFLFLQTHVSQILLCEVLNGRLIAKLSDFGIARQEVSMRVAGSSLLPIHAPEQRYTQKADVFAYGVLLYALLGGKVELPFNRANVRVYPSGLPYPNLCGLVDCCVAEDEDERPDFSAICSALEACCTLSEIAVEANHLTILKLITPTERCVTNDAFSRSEPA